MITIFNTLILILPLSLAKHFIIPQSYVQGLMVDYLVPTVYVTDLLLILLGVGLIGKHLVFGRYGNNRGFDLKPTQRANLLIWAPFFLVLLVSSLNSFSLQTSLYKSISVILKFVLFAYVVLEKPLLYKTIKLLLPSTIFISVLGIFQFFHGGSIFDNYLFFGEQPYSFSTFDILRDELFGNTIIPAYSIFPHPNVLAGYLSIVLLWILVTIKPSFYRDLTYLLGVMALFLTFSLVGWGVFLFGHFVLFVQNSIQLRKLVLASILFSVVITIGLFFVGQYFPVHSLSTRSALLKSSYALFLENPFIGVGLNNSTILIEKHLNLAFITRFVQPPHNIFVLLLVEVGLVGFLSLLFGMYYAASRTSQKSVFLVTFIQIILIGTFDHYLWTIHQTQLLFWLTLAFMLTYTKNNETS